MIKVIIPTLNKKNTNNINLLCYMQQIGFFQIKKTKKGIECTSINIKSVKLILLTLYMVAF